mgnify:CR=1 FL=1
MPKFFSYCSFRTSACLFAPSVSVVRRLISMSAGEETPRDSEFNTEAYFTGADDYIMLNQTEGKPFANKNFSGSAAYSAPYSSTRSFLAGPNEHIDTIASKYTAGCSSVISTVLSST